MRQSLLAAYTVHLTTKLSQCCKPFIRIKITMQQLFLSRTYISWNLNREVLIIFYEDAAFLEIKIHRADKEKGSDIDKIWQMSQHICKEINANEHVCVCVVLCIDVVFHLYVGL